jgi:quinoprotein glucose dehydrogenase
MTFRTGLPKAVFACAVLGFIAFPVRYSWGVMHTFGIDSQLTYNGALIRYMFHRRYQFDIWKIEALAHRGTGGPIEVHNENIEQPRAITRTELLMSAEPPDTPAGDPFQIIKGISGAADTGPADPAGNASATPTAAAPAAADSARRYSSLRAINRDNVKNLKLLHVVDAEALFKGQWLLNTESAPLNWGALVYWLSADDRLIAVNVETGGIAWQVKIPSFGWSRRGFLLDDHAANGRATLYVPMWEFVVALDAETGTLVRAVADGGVIPLQGSTVLSPLLWNGQLIVALYDQQAIAGIDLKSGIRQWTVSLHDAARNFSGGTPWGGMAIDRERALLFVSTGNPRPALLGSSRPGDNRNSDSVLAIDLRRQVIRWAFQEVRHDLWDFDIPAGPILTRISANGRPYDVVVAVTKIGNTLILDRDSGRPIFDFRLRRAPGSRHVNERTAPYQPDVQQPEPLIDIEFSPAMVTNISAESRDFVARQLSEQGNLYGRFTPPELNKDLVTFGLHGGAEWHGAALSPETGMLYVPVNMIPWVIRVYLQADPRYRLAAATGRQGTSAYADKCSSCHLASGNGVFESVGEAATRYVPSLHGYSLLPGNQSLFRVGTFARRPHHQGIVVTQAELDQIWTLLETSDANLFAQGHPTVTSHWRQLLDAHGLPGSAPPWGKVVALNLSNGKKVWETPLGDKIIGGTPANTGSPSYGGLIATAGGLIFVVGTDDGYVRALDETSGETLWRYRMTAAGSAPPATFEVNGKQYVCVVATGGRFHNFAEKADKLYIFSL